MTQGLALIEGSEGEGGAKGVHGSRKLFRKPKAVLDTDEHLSLFLNSANAPPELGLERDMSKKAFVRAEEEFS